MDRPFNDGRLHHTSLESYLLKPFYRGDVSQVKILSFEEKCNEQEVLQFSFIQNISFPFHMRCIN